MSLRLVSRILLACLVPSVCLMVACDRSPDSTHKSAEVSAGAEDTRNQASDAQRASASPSELSQLDIGELNRLKEASLRGDPEAAFSVYQFYADQELWRESDEWLHVGAENGNPLLMDRLGRELWHAGGAENCLRASFWLKRALGNPAISGDEISSAAIHEILSEISSRSGQCAAQ